MATMRTFLPTPTKFNTRKVEFWNGTPKKQDIPSKQKASSLQKRVPETDEEYVEYYQDRIYNAQRRQLFPLQEDLADWLNKTLGTEYITGDNFLDMLDNGVVLCQLARVIHERAQQAIDSGLHKGTVPEINSHCFENAARRSFFSRDNMENFIKFCRKLGVHQNLLFESDDLVLQHQPRNVVLCLLELSRITTKFNMEPPGLVQLEKEIAEEEERTEAGKLNNSSHYSSMLSWQFRPSPDSALHSSLPIKTHKPSATKKKKDNKIRISQKRDRSASEDSSTEADRIISGSECSDHDEWLRDIGEDLEEKPVNPLNELDMKVEQATKIAQKHCHCDSKKCSKLAVRKVGDGKYNIAGRNVFVRLLKGRHMMVRVGGGWDTLEHFLLRHDPCQVRVLNRGQSPAPGLSSPMSTVGGSHIPVPHNHQNHHRASLSDLQHLAKTPTIAGAQTFLHIRAKYRSPPPP